MISLFIKPEKVISPPVVLANIVDGVNNANNSGKTLFPFINLPAKGKEKSITGVIIISICLFFILLSRNPCGSIYIDSKSLSIIYPFSIFGNYILL